jgi:hypothetical protein
MRRDQLIWGIILLLLGSLMLAGNMGITLPNGNSLMSLFWPLLLIFFGAWVLFGVFLRGKVESESASIDLQGATEASLRINHGAGEINVHSGASGSELAHGTFVGGMEHKASRNGDRLEVRMRPATDVMAFPFFGSRSQLDWDVALNASIPTVLEMNLGANKSNLDLHDMTITDLKLKSGASDTVLTLPARGRLNADFEIGAASLTLIVPDGVAIRVRASLGAGDLNVNRSRFPNDESPEFETAANAVDINVKGGACSVKIK